MDFEVPADDVVLKDLLLSFKRERPSPARTVVSWNLQLVLEVFKSGRFEDYTMISDKELTLKIVFLLALASGKRRSELHAFSRADVFFEEVCKNHITRLFPSHRPPNPCKEEVLMYF